MRISLPQKPLPETIFRICSTFNAMGLALEANALRRERNLDVVAVGRRADRGSRDRRTDRPGMPNR
jgi:hypothetical protein